MVRISQSEALRQRTGSNVRDEKTLNLSVREMMILLVMATTVLVTAAGVEIVRTSPKEVMVRRGDALDLYCDSITPYQVRPH